MLLRLFGIANVFSKYEMKLLTVGLPGLRLSDALEMNIVQPHNTNFCLND